MSFPLCQMLAVVCKAIRALLMLKHNYSGINGMGEWGVTLDPHSVSLAGLKSSAYVRFSLLALSSIFFLVDPFAALPTFLAVTAGVDAQRRRKMAWKASLTALVVLSAFAVAGQYIFRMFGITLPAFEIAGGIILLLIGLDMLAAKRSPTQESSAEAAEAALKEDAGIVPLGIPMLAGPGAITSVMVLVGQAQTRWQMVAILMSIFITAAICYLVLGNSDRVARAMGETGVRILVRIMGLLLVALAVQYFVNGMADLGVIARP
jgi:multiple antibiotic resistance protein